MAAGTFSFSLAPLFFEYTAELAYPAPEGLVAGFLTCGMNLLGCIFFCLFFIPGIGTVWMNYVLVASAIVSIPAVIFTKESYGRLDIDVPNSSDSSSESGNDSSNPYATLES